MFGLINGGKLSLSHLGHNLWFYVQNTWPLQSSTCKQTAIWMLQQDDNRRNMTLRGWISEIVGVKVQVMTYAFNPQAQRLTNLTAFNLVLSDYLPGSTDFDNSSALPTGGQPQHLCIYRKHDYYTLLQQCPKKWRRERSWSSNNMRQSRSKRLKCLTVIHCQTLLWAWLPTND